MDDFISRLNGHLDVLDINPTERSATELGAKSIPVEGQFTAHTSLGHRHGTWSYVKMIGTKYTVI